MHVGPTNRMDFSVFMSMEMSTQVMFGRARPRTKVKGFISSLEFTVPSFPEDLVMNRLRLCTMTVLPRLNLARKSRITLIAKQSVNNPLCRGLLLANASWHSHPLSHPTPFSSTTSQCHCVLIDLSFRHWRRTALKGIREVLRIRSNVAPEVVMMIFKQFQKTIP